MKRIVLLLLACFPSVFMLAQVPETYWIPDNVGQFNITLFAQLSLAGDIPNSQDSPVANYELGVFDQDGKCCGVAFPPTWKNVRQRWVYSLAIQGETGSTYTFKIYDHATGQEQVLSMACSEDVDHYEFNVVEDTSSPNYGDGCTYGYTYAPDTLHFMPTQKIVLVAGWNWVSTYIEMEDVDGLGMLKEGLGANGLYIQNGLLYTESWEEDGVVYWYGSLDEEAMRNETMYMVQVAADCSVTLEGVLADPAAHPITINPGWNWIGFPCDHAMSIEEAFANFTVADGDAIQQGISYSDALVDEEGVLWFGSVRELRPGQGFMYYSASSGVKTLVFGTVSSAKRNR